MVRCGFVCYCMFDWLVGFHNLILLVDFRLFPKAAAKGSFKKSAVIKHCYQTLPKVLLK